jgi:hypothetical protein
MKSVPVAECAAEAISQFWSREHHRGRAISHREAEPAGPRHLKRNDEARAGLPSWSRHMDRKRSASEEAVLKLTQKKLGEAIRSQYDLARPLPEKLYALVMQLDGPNETGK